MDWVKQGRAGEGEIVLNVMNADGTTAGYDLEMTAAVSDAVKIPVVASGGAGSPQHMLDVLTAGHADAALAASIFHFGTFSIQEVKRFLAVGRKHSAGVIWCAGRECAVGFGAMSQNVPKCPVLAHFSGLGI